MLVEFTYDDKKDEWNLYLETCVFANNTSMNPLCIYHLNSCLLNRSAVIEIDVETEKKKRE